MATDNAKLVLILLLISQAYANWVDVVGLDSGPRMRLLTELCYQVQFVVVPEATVLASSMTLGWNARVGALLGFVTYCYERHQKCRLAQKKQSIC